ncbi:MAG: hypothetical protein ABR588_03730 [Sphingomicrobium sp.]
MNALPAEFLLACWSLGLVFAAFLILFRAFGRLGTPTWARLGALAFLCFAPTYVGQETVDFRIWEGGLAVFLSSLFLDRLLALKQSTELPMRRLALLSVLPALLFFVSPPLGLAAYICALIFGLRSLRRPLLWRAGLISGCTLACLLLPWTIRNDLVLGEPVVLRSNSGLELAVSNYPIAWEDPDHGRAFKERLFTIHPAQNMTAYRTMQSIGGELAYSQRLGGEARGWIAGHKREFLFLAIRHVRQIFVPEPWQYTTFGTGKFPILRAALAGVVGLAGLLLALLLRRRDWIFPFMMIAVPALTLAPFQPVPRYTYLFYPLLSYCAADLISVLLRRWPVRFNSRHGPASMDQFSNRELPCDPGAACDK